MMFCGMQNGAIRVYLMEEYNPSLTNLKDYWHFNVHDSDYGCIKDLSTSFDDRFLVTVGADSNIFVFDIISEFELEKGMKAKLPPPRVCTKTEQKKKSFFFWQGCTFPKALILKRMLKRACVL